MGHEGGEVRGDRAHALDHVGAGTDELADRVGERAVRDADLRVAAAPEDRRAALLGRAGRFEDEAGLPDSGFALDDDDAAAAVAGVAPERGERRDLRPPSDERARPGIGGPARRWGHLVEGQTGRRAEEPPVGVFGLGGRAHTELRVEEPAQRLVRGERRGSVPRLVPRGHQEPGGLLLERVPLDRGAGQLDRVGVTARPERGRGLGVRRPSRERGEAVAPVEHPRRVAPAEERMAERVERRAGQARGGVPVAVGDEALRVEHPTERGFDVHDERVGDLEAGGAVGRGERVG